MAEEGMSPNRYEAKEDDEHWKDYTDKEFLNAYPIEALDDKLDEDYIMFVHYATKLADKGASYDFNKYKAWLEKLITEPATSLTSKRSRNIYLSQLILQLKEGRLQGVLADNPPEGELPPTREVFQFAAMPQEKTAHDLEMEVNIESGRFMNVSADGRTYLAAQPLPNDNGICGYLAVSTGEESKGLWLDSCGRPTTINNSAKIDIMSTRKNKCGNEETGVDINKSPRSGGADLQDVVKKRLSEEGRTKLVKFYEDVLTRIEKTLKCFKDSKDPIEINDPVIKQMLNKLKCNIPTVGGVLCAPLDIHARTLLMALQKRIISKLKDISTRSQLIDDIKSMFIEEESVKLVDLSKNINDQCADEAWISVMHYKPQKVGEVILSKVYGDRLIKALYCLFERQKQIIYEQEKNAHQRTLASYRDALVEEIKEYVEKYLITRKKWQRVHDVSNAIKEIEKEIWTSLKSEYVVGSESDNDVLIESAAKDIQNQINEAKKIGTLLDTDVLEMRNRIEHTKSNYREVYEKLRQTGEQRRNQINHLKTDANKQERKIIELKSILQSYQSSR